MVSKKDRILIRIEEIKNSVSHIEGTKAYLTLGSAGAEVERLDDYSDIDFFLIVESGYKKRFIENLDWLSEISPVGFCFQNTKDGHKLLYTDGIFCEFAVFEESEMKTAVFSKGLLRWHASDFDQSLCIPSVQHTPDYPASLEWALNEALTCLYVGLNRYARGELLSGTRFVQNYAVDLIISTSTYLMDEIPNGADAFQHERRYEGRFPELAKVLPDMIQGYTRTKESAVKILNFIERYHHVNPWLKSEILRLI
jgi:hypothetical protein